MESTLYVFPFRMVFFCLVTTDWIFDISLCENSINQSIDHIRKTVEQEAERIMAKGTVTEKVRAGLRHAVAIVCPNVTRRTKERIAQSKRARAGSLATLK